MVYRRHSVISQPALPGMASDPLVEWMRLHRRPKERNRKRRPTAAEKRLEEARKDPRQVPFEFFKPLNDNAITKD